MVDKKVFESGLLLLPEMERLLKNRYQMLQTIHTHGRIGRRPLAEALNRTEREVRNDMAVLGEMGLIQVIQRGMNVTELGYVVLEQLKSYFYDVSGLAEKEKQLARYLNISKVAIVASDVDQNPQAKSLLGKEASFILRTNAKPKSVVAVTGGSSVATLRRNLFEEKPFNSMKFVAARGSMSHDVNFQANTLVAKFAKECGATYHTLFLPEHLSEQAYLLMMEEPSVKETVNLYDEANVVIHGIGSASEMGMRRNMPQEQYSQLLDSGAIGEAFGYYFDEAGKITYQTQTVGIQLEQVQKSDLVIAIAAGKSKAKAIEAYFKMGATNCVLVTDEGAADEILKNI